MPLDGGDGISIDGENATMSVSAHAFSAPSRMAVRGARRSFS
jgi:hypothetical protein